MDFPRGKNFIRVTGSATFLFLFFLPLISTQDVSIWEYMPLKKELRNGMTVIYHKDESTALTALQILFKGGTGAVPDEKDGLAYLTTRLVVEIPDMDKVQELMSQASSVSMNCRGDYSLITISCLSENLERTLKVMAYIMCNPLFSSLRITNNKEYMVYRKKLDEDDSTTLAHNAQLEAFFGENGYGSPVLGTRESLKGIKSKDIEDFYRKYFTGKNMIISVSSDLGENELMNMLDKLLGQFPRGEFVKLKPSSPSVPEEKQKYFEKDAEQTLISIIFPLPGMNRKNFVLATFTENLLGKGVNSKLWPLRSREKLAYNVDSHAVQMKEGGILKTYLETENEKKEIALEALKKILNSIHEEGITEEEFQEVKVTTRANFLRSNETKTARTANLAYFETTGLGYDFLIRFFSELDSLTYEETNAYIKEILDPEKGVEVVVGPKNGS